MEMAEGEFPGCYRERKRSQLRRGWQQPLWFASPGCHVCWVHSAGPTLTFKTGAAAAVEYVDSAVRKLVSRSKGTFRRLSAFRLGDSGIAFAANCGRCLKVLEIPMREVNDKIVVKFAESLVNLSVMDISYCLKITHVGIEAFGKNCKSLTQLKRNMPHKNWKGCQAHQRSMSLKQRS
ncbi:hypothetical protein J1N35_027631 [Gossypium stocksii]|uniref:F-box domain-containing protein n=1 Tax=Gossypium stocksii TaxID=47602 RepID=A0A9D4A0E3_9ROSI|nr:hypothetical protein J1N35_027631 [Gossypium stocksii]